MRLCKIWGYNQRPWLIGKSYMPVCMCLEWVPIFYISRTGYAVRKQNRYRPRSEGDYLLCHLRGQEGFWAQVTWLHFFPTCFLVPYPISLWQWELIPGVSGSKSKTQWLQQKAKATTSPPALSLPPWVKDEIASYSFLSLATYYSLWHMAGLYIWFLMIREMNVGQDKM